MAAKILKKRASDTRTIVRRKTVLPSHPKRLAATTAMNVTPSTAELVQAKLSQFSEKIYQEFFLVKFDLLQNDFVQFRKLQKKNAGIKFILILLYAS